jgi:hypothetical protein
MPTTHRDRLAAWMVAADLLLLEEVPPVTMFDSVDWQAIPADAPIVAGYDDGTYMWPPQAWARFVTAIKIRITVTGKTGDQICDCERGDLTPTGAAAWAHGEHTAGRIPTIYSNRSDRSQLTAPMADLRLFVDWNWWAADPTGGSHIVPGSVATQWGWFPHVDESTVIPGWPHPVAVIPTPSLPTGPAGPFLGGFMSRVCEDPITGGSWAVQADGAVYTADGAPYLGGANSHPAWTVGGPANPVVGIVPWKGDGTNKGGNGYAIVTTWTADTTGDPFRYYRFPRAGIPA